jgi:hypothetical protein
MKKEIYVYISGPITVGGPVKNTRKAIDVAEKVMKMGMIPYVPHLNLLWEVCYPKATKLYLKMDLSWVEKCNILYRIKGFSRGAEIEVAHAKKVGVPVVHNFNQLQRHALYLRGGQTKIRTSPKRTKKTN